MWLDAMIVQDAFGCSKKANEFAMAAELKDGVAIVVLTSGITWGVAAFLLGLAGSFTLYSVHLIESLVPLAFGWVRDMNGTAGPFSFFVAE